MPIYKYTARTPEGKKTSNIIEAPDASKVAETIQQFGFMPLLIKERKPSILTKDISPFSKVSVKDILMFTRQCAALQGAGLSLIESLDAILDQADNDTFVKVLKNIRQDIASGETFSTALAKNPEYFPPIYTSMIKVGEKTGLLGDILDRLTDFISYEESVKNKIKKATRYPLMVLVSLVFASIVLVVYVLPNFMGMFAMYNGTLPLPTRILLAVNYFIMKFWPLLIGLLAGAGWYLKAKLKTEAGRTYWDGLLLRFPVIGPLIKQLIVSRFARVLALLNQSGISILEAIQIVSQTTDNRVIMKSLAEVRAKVRSGKSIAESMNESGLFQSTIINMVAVGEKSGQLSEMLLKVADVYDEEVDITLDNLSSLIEPILIGFMALLVLFMALAVFLPMWNMLSLMQQ